MVCRNDQYRAAIQWDDIAIYSFVAEPTKYEHCLIDALNSLPVSCRKMVILLVFEQLSHKIIAGILRMSVTDVRLFIHCSGLAIRKYLNEHGHPSVPDAKMDKIFKGWPYLEFGAIAELHRHMEFIMA